LLFKACYALGAEKSRLVIKVAGGATINEVSGLDYFQIGKRNIVMLRKLLWRNGVFIKAESVGGDISRTLTLDIESGRVTILSRGRRQDL
jgi:chemotaxis protein CheD